jgi:hypothetical protein
LLIYLIGTQPDGNAEMLTKYALLYICLLRYLKATKNSDFLQSILVLSELQVLKKGLQNCSAISNRIPQDSVLSPILFVLYISEMHSLPANLPNHSQTNIKLLVKQNVTTNKYKNNSQTSPT